jgi:hypothetical protein
VSAPTPRRLTDQEQIAAFIARKGVTLVQAGVGACNHMTAHDWRKAARSTTRVSPAADTEQRLIDQRHVVVDHLGREHVRNGLGEWLS